MAIFPNPERIDCGFIQLVCIPTAGSSIYYAKTNEKFYSQMLRLPKFLYVGLVDLNLVDELAEEKPLAIDFRLLFQGDEALITAFISNVMRYAGFYYLNMQRNETVYKSIREKFILPHLCNYHGNDEFSAYSYMEWAESETERTLQPKKVLLSDKETIEIPIKNSQIALEDFSFEGLLTGLEMLDIEDYNYGNVRDGKLIISVKDRDDFIHSLATQPFSN